MKRSEKFGQIMNKSKTKYITNQEDKTGSVIIYTDHRKGIKLQITGTKNYHWQGTTIYGN